MKKLIHLAFLYAVLAMAGGVFYREFTKFNGSSGGSLAFVHTHLFVLGMIFFLVVALLEHQFAISGQKLYRVFFWLYNIGLTITAIALVWRGVLQTLAVPLSKGLDASISGVAGTGHILLGTGIILFFISLKKACLKNQKGE